jgi:hypothetical protein
VRSHHRDHATGLVRPRLELLRLPARERGLHRVTRVGAAEQRDDARAVVREVRVQAHDPAVARAVHARDRIPERRGRLAVDAQVALAAELDRRRAHVDGDALRATAAQPPQLRRRESGRRDRRLRGGADPERRRQRGLLAGERDPLERGRVAARERPELSQRIARGRHSAHTRPAGNSRQS